MVPAEGDVISVQAVAVAADGRVWFASGRTTGYDVPRGLAAGADGSCVAAQGHAARRRLDERY